MSCKVTQAMLGCDLTHSCVRLLAGYMYDRHVPVRGCHDGHARPREGCTPGCIPVHSRKTNNSSKLK